MISRVIVVVVASLLVIPRFAVAADPVPVEEHIGISIAAPGYLIATCRPQFDASKEKFGKALDKWLKADERYINAFRLHHSTLADFIDSKYGAGKGAGLVTTGMNGYKQKAQAKIDTRLAGVSDKAAACTAALNDFDAGAFGIASTAPDKAGLDAYVAKWGAEIPAGSGVRFDVMPLLLPK